MKKAILSVLAALSLLVGGHALPASATTWPPGASFRSTFGDCRVDVISGDFGQSFGNVTLVGSGCAEVYVRIKAVVNGNVGATPYCQLSDVLFHGPTTYCSFLINNGIIGVQAHLPGSSGWLETDFQICTPSACSGIRALTLL